jgi:hypothetical protein
MKLLFVGEGATDIGSPGFANPPRRATGVLFILSRKVCPSIDSECLAVFLQELVILNREKRGNIYAARVAKAMVLAAAHGCSGTVFVVDRDNDEDRLKNLEEGIGRGLAALGVPHRAVVGVAIKTIEAWMLGTPSALAAALQIAVAEITREYNPHAVEDMHPRSGKPEKQSDRLLASIAEIGYRVDSTAFREEIAELANIDELERHCKEGFKPFADKLRGAFGRGPIC